MQDIEVAKLEPTHIHGKDQGEHETGSKDKGILLICPLCEDIWKAPFPIPQGIKCKCGYVGAPARPVLKKA